MGSNNTVAGTGTAFGASVFGTGNTVASQSGIALGTDNTVSGLNAVAIGANASAGFDNSAAYGNGATTTRANQQVFGTASNTYTMAGVTSTASKTAQGTRTQLVTSNDSGDLAAYTPSSAPSVQAKSLRSTRSGNWGTFEGENGFAMNAALRIGKNMQLNGGVAYGLSENIAGGRVGVRVAW